MNFINPMKRSLVFSLYLFVLIAVTAQTPQQLMQQGNDAYSKGDYATAVDAYNAIYDAGQHSADLYYNLGNAYYRQEELGLAILNYERALRINPHFKDARQNLELAYSKTEDKIDSLPQLFIVNWALAVIRWFSPNGWLVVLLILVILLGALTILFFISNDYAWRKRSLLAGIFCALILLISIGCTIAAFHQANRHDKAIVTNPMIVVKSSPETTGIDKIILHEGTPVAIDETLGDWHRIHIADGNSGWVETSDITII